MLVQDLDSLVESLKSTIRENSVCTLEYDETIECTQVVNSESLSTLKSGTAKPPKKPERTKSRKITRNEECEEKEFETKLEARKRIVSLADPMDIDEPKKNEKVGMPGVSLQSNLSELDTLLADLNTVKYRVEQENRLPGSGSASYAYGDYYSDLDSTNEDRAPDRPPPPQSYAGPSKTKTKVPNPNLLAPPSTHYPSSPQPPTSRGASLSPLPSIVTRKPRRPPKLMHILKDGEKRRVHDLAKENRENDNMDIEVPDEGDYGDYTSKWEYLGKGIWENNDYGSVSNYSTAKTSQREDYDYTTLSKSPLPMTDDELEQETGAGPRGESSRFIPTDHGEVKSKYNYLGFGLWENTDPAKPKPKKPSPPPPPPKAEPVWYNCSVVVSTTLSTKELDDLNMNDNFSNLPKRFVEVGDGVGDLGAGIGEPFEMFEKEDMSDMFRRAMFEKMNLFDDDKRKKYNCAVCSRLIGGLVITAMARKYHPECFVCTYCRKEFKDRKFKSDPRDGKPYCFDCFEKLLGHFGTAHGPN